ncbi:prephenate dehydratase [Magnetospirillum aberrantis]|uniref:prephenate dehydratase n=1 Tax=Magnetospirillum aberrantis SpK TaxID=908842 RepID=A0A7C9URJ9_9PROT|nr:prephenate dehydratase [Magnetospirillum aberrantis]NFV78647.1 prephenate dehydratase [Magnetospirillum aberrantis SpK]
MTTSDSANSIAFQGLPGAYSHLACRNAFPAMQPLPCATFEDAFAAVREGRARYAMIPIDNSVAGRVADVHHLLPYSGLHIIAEHFERIQHHLLAPKGASLDSITSVESHVHALGQCRNLIRQLGLKVIVGADTAGSAAELAKSGDLTRAAIASELAAEIYGLDSLKANIEDAEHNTTRFVVLARDAIEPNPNQPCVTTIVFRVRNVPAALYKAMGGFATNGINITKLESYLVGGEFVAAQFYADVEGHPSQRSLRLALEELEFFSHEVRIVGVYPAHPFRLSQNVAGE